MSRKVFLKKEPFIEAKTGHKMFEGGFCSLHAVHNSFHKLLKELNLNIDELAVDLFSFLKDSPARREDFKKH